MRLATWWVVQKECPTHPTCHLHGVNCSYHIIDIHLVLWEGLQPVSFKNASNISNEIHADYAIGRVSQQKFPNMIWHHNTYSHCCVFFLLHLLQYVLVPGQGWGDAETVFSHRNGSYSFSDWSFRVFMFPRHWFPTGSSLLPSGSLW